MPVQPAISAEQVIITIMFLMMLFGLMWFVKRYRGGISSRLHPARRMQHIEDLALGPQQRLHLIEVDGRTFLVHAGKGHAASFQPVNGTSFDAMQIAPEMTAAAALTDIAAAGPAVSKSGKSGKSGTSQSVRKPAPQKPAAKAAAPAKPKSAFAAAIAQARRNNPSLGFEK